MSLENFNQKSSKEPILKSPRSLEACRRQGILPKELVMLTIDEVKSMYGDNKVDKDGLELLAQHYEERRMEKIRVLLDERNQIIEEEQNGLISFPSKLDVKSKSQMSSMYNRSQQQTGASVYGDSTLIDKERRQLEKIKLRQEKELKQMLDYETKMAEIQRIQDEKLEKQRERERNHEREVASKRQEAEEKRLHQEELKRQRAEEEEEHRRQLAAEEYRREQERAHHEKQKERERKFEARKREEEQKRKHEEFVQQTEQKLLEQQMIVDAKKQEMEERDRIRIENLKEQQMLQHQEAEQRRLIHEEKLRLAKEKNDEIIAQKRIEFEERQARNENKRKQFERELERKKFENRAMADYKAQNIKKVLNENQRMEERKKQEFYHKKALAEERKRELDIEADYERQRKIHYEREKEEQRRRVKENMEMRLQERVGGYLEKMAESDEKVMRVHQEKEIELRSKHALELIKKHDKLENVERIARMQEYQREKLLEKIQEDTERANAIKNEKHSLLEARMGVRRDMDKSKRSLMEQFDLVKRGKINPETVSAEFGRSSSLMQSQGPRLHTSSQRSTGVPYSAASQKRGIASAEQAKRHNSDKQHYSTDDKKVGKQKNPQKEARKEVESLKARQNHEMLSLLEEEQNRENERELMLKSIHDHAEREKTQKAFGMDRARAHARIQQLADSHDDAIKRLMTKYNLKNIY